jgi:hypothetical protein
MNYVEHIRLLCCEFEIQTNSPEIYRLLHHVTQRAEQNVPVVHRESLTITWTDGEFRITGDDMEEDFELSASCAVESIYQHLHGRAIATLPDHIRVNAACGMHEEHSFLIVGPQPAGRTTLTISLLLDGVDMNGDGLVLLHDGEALPFPRRFHLAEEGIARLPKLKSIGRFAARAENPQEGRLVSLDPLELAMPWRIAPAAVSALFYIEPNHGAETKMSRSGKVEMIRRVLPHCAPPLSGRRDWVGDICTTLDRADTFVIELGDLTSAVAQIVSALN